MAIALNMLMKKGVSCGFPSLNTELKAADDYLEKDNYPLPGMKPFIGFQCRPVSTMSVCINYKKME